MPESANIPYLEGKRIVVTGSSMGIGQAVAIRLAKEAAKVMAKWVMEK